jgi:hypothetical protein
MKFRKAFARLVGAVAVASWTACTPTFGGFDPDDITIDPDIFCAETGCVGLVVEAAVAPRMLKGDTLRVYTRSDSGLSALVAWEVEGAGEMVSQSQIAWPVPYGSEGRSILVRGLMPGNVEVRATHPLPRTATLTLGVADSSVISGIKLSSFASPKWLGDPDFVASTSMRVGDSVWVNAVLRDQSGQDYAGRPENWTISDTTVAVMRVNTVHPFAGPPVQRRWIRARAAGVVDVVATFLSVQQTIRITVVP